MSWKAGAPPGGQCRTERSRRCQWRWSQPEADHQEPQSRRSGTEGHDDGNIHLLETERIGEQDFIHGQAVINLLKRAYAAGSPDGREVPWPAASVDVSTITPVVAALAVIELAGLLVADKYRIEGTNTFAPCGTFWIESARRVPCVAMPAPARPVVLRKGFVVSPETVRCPFR